MTYKRKLITAALLLTLLIILVFPALTAGQYDIEAGKVFGLIWGKISGGETAGISRAQEVIVWRIRLPRLILALTAGLSLAVSGAAYQGCFRNPLVEPYILGVSAGAACGAALAIVYPHIFPQGQLTAFLFALAAVTITYGLARSRGETSSVALVLSGIIVGALFGAVVGIMKYLAADAQLREITFWMMGGLYYATWDDARLTVLCVAPAFIFLWWYGWHLNVLSLGDEEARSLGLNPAFCRFMIIIAATFAAAVCVSTCGVIAWVGLMMPHAARMIFGPDNRWVVPVSALLGGIFLLICDTIARTLAPAEIPLGIVASIVGAPYLLWLLRSKGRDIYGR
ncbi:MAG: iron ABC transporter permease [Candidatus Adiutrix sp.]|nr:iron ABC transporter permease [Candidatus Adiutrix sp.]